MGSVIDCIECTNCKCEASSDFYYKTGEEFINCTHCGYSKSYTIINRDKKINDLTDEDWKIEELKNPYGSYRLKPYKSIATQLGSFANKEEYDYFIKEVNKNEELEFCSISQLIDGKIITKIIFDNGPKIDSAGFTQEDKVNGKLKC